MFKAVLILMGMALSLPALAESDNNCEPQEGLVQYSVTRSDEGYTFLLPPGLLKRFPNKAEYKVTLRTKDGITASIIGTGQKEGENLLNLSAAKRFDVTSIDRNALEYLDIYPVGEGPEIGSCSGCPRDNALACLGDCNICYCEHPRKREADAGVIDGHGPDE